jgi:hypothetical protein
MPQITRPSLVLALLCWLMALTLAGCGDTNSKSDYEPERGEHPEGWLPSGHAEAARGHASTCTPCHGQNLLGGISKVSCARCHGSSIGTGGTDGGVIVTDVHPWGWGQFAYALHAQYVRQRALATGGTGADECSTRFCHGTNLEGGEGGAGPSCSACHLGGPFRIHPADWERRFTSTPGVPVPTYLPDHGDYVNANGSARCTIQECHGTGEPQPGDLFSTGRACRACHF